MREVKQTKGFRQSLKRLSRGVYRKLLVMPDGELWQVVRLLANDILLPPKYQDHPLHGKYEGARDCVKDSQPLSLLREKFAPHSVVCDHRSSSSYYP